MRFATCNKIMSFLFPSLNRSECRENFQNSRVNSFPFQLARQSARSCCISQVVRLYTGSLLPPSPTSSSIPAFQFEDLLHSAPMLQYFLIISHYLKVRATLFSIYQKSTPIFSGTQSLTNPVEI